MTPLGGDEWRDSLRFKIYGCIIHIEGWSGCAAIVRCRRILSSTSSIAELVDRGGGGLGLANFEERTTLNRISIGWYDAALKALLVNES